MATVANLKILWTVLYLLISLTRLVITMDKQMEEPVCTSRFDYEYKILHKMVMLEIEQNKLKELMAEMSTLPNILKEESLQTRAIVDRVEKRLKEIDAKKSYGGAGNTYVRWGRTECPGNGTEMVYKGYAGGGFYDNEGAASNYLCLPEEPVWGVYEDSEQVAGTVYGAEYELYNRNMDKFFGKALHHQDVPCCVCRTKRPSAIMLPGRNICYDGWTLEYSGYLTSGYENHHATEFVCLDGDPEAIGGGESNVNGKLFYFVEARCGSLRCPPYVNGRELTCAVCTK
ncbi:uncharacterized protein LOC123531884 [Mercenaria mercenaria]|uniref:uncharacterized protein LOC123531884 n=1 Tax=Mercenaria mercenaria TaxID=6596 RepID=UPI00234EA515|nr:uncharacterized protein LOC123531884 [Mercenaria mercenaria]